MPDAPKRIQMRRTKGWRKPAAVIYVGRPTMWGNPYRIGDLDPVTCSPMTAANAVFWFAADLDPLVSASAESKRLAIQKNLRGHDLGCWCLLDRPCHADVLLEIANA
jgi:hypothetical protein